MTLTRRGAFAGLAGAATATLSASALASTTREPLTEPHTAAARASQSPPLAMPGARSAWADVSLCRSWDRQVYLVISDEVRGFVELDDRGFALAAAARAANRRIAVQYWGHEPAHADVGRFDGALLAFDIADLPGVAEWR